MQTVCCSPLSTEFDRNVLLTIKNYGGYNNRSFLAVFRLAEFFPAAFRLMRKIFGLAAKFGGLGSSQERKKGGEEVGKKKRVGDRR